MWDCLLDRLPPGWIARAVSSFVTVCKVLHVLTCTCRCLLPHGSKGVTQIFGLIQEELVGKPLADFLHPTHLEEFQVPFVYSTFPPPLFHLTVSSRGPDGKSMWRSDV